jgi:hypothetical protein
MALGGGTFVTQNKVLPGAYINFVAAAKASATLSERGIATIPLSLDWGEVGKVIEVTTGDLQKNSMRLFGYDYTSPQLRPLRELFKNIRIGYLYRLGTGGTAASNIYGTAKYVGTRGNAITIVVKENVDDAAKKDVSVLMDGVTVASQTVSGAADLKDDDFVIYEKTGTLNLTAGTPMTGGANPNISNANHQSYLDAIESYTFNAIGCPSNEETVKGLYTAFTRRLRDEQGVKFQCVAFDEPADYEGVVNVMNGVTDSGADIYSLIYWVTGVIAGTNVNKSALNKIYDGEFTVNVNYTQTQLETAIKTGKFAFHRVNDDVRVLSDINSLVTVTAEKGEIFKENQTIRVIDQIANDIAVIFNTRYLGIIPNDEAGRISLWSDIVKHHEQLQEIRAIENFKSDDVVVTQGNTKRSVLVSDLVTVVNAMAQLYMVVTVA